jgi:GNAT superfamily N-acetyltransferase
MSTSKGIRNNIVRIRRSSIKDIDVLVSQRRKMWEDIHDFPRRELNVGDKVYRKWLVEMIRKRKLFGFVAIANKDRVVGSGCIWLRKNQPMPGSSSLEMPYLLSMYTDPEFRRMGIASRIVKEAMKFCKSGGYRRMTLHGSSVGRRVYSKLGWERTWEMRVNL